MNPLLKTLCILLCFIPFISLNSQDIRVGLFYTINVQSIEFESQNPETYILSKHDTVSCLKSGDHILFEKNSGHIRIYKNRISLGFYDSIFVTQQNESSIMVIKINRTEAEYKGNFKIYLSNGAIRIINLIDLEEYVKSVCIAESGHREKEEYYKVQAILARTYALFNRDKHEKEGYDVCDYTHCQVYKGFEEIISLVQFFDLFLLASR